MAADDVTSNESGTAALEPPAAAARERTRGGRLYENRFGVAYLALAVVVSGAIIALAVLLREPGHGSGAKWSAWQPTAGGIEGARQIAQHIGARYRLPSGNQIVANLVSPLSVSGVQLSQIAVRNGTGPRDVTFYDTRRNVPYTMCGLGDRCSITEGKPSRERQRLIRRQALELALYSFKYLDVDSALTYLPPPKGQSVSYAVFFLKDQLKPALELPLAATLPSRGPFVSGRLTPDAEIVERLTAERVFAVTFQSIPDGTAIVVLSPRELT